MHARERDSCGELSDAREDGEVSLSSRASSSHANSTALLICALNYWCTYYVSYNSVFTVICLFILYLMNHGLKHVPKWSARGWGGLVLSPCSCQFAIYVIWY